VSFLRSSHLEAPETLLGGRYQLVEQLGAGGFGQTFIAEDRHLPGHPRCVLKQLQPQITDPNSLQTAKRLFDAEAQALYQLGNHDQIPRLLAHFEHGQEFYLAQELVVGQTLSKELMVGQPWSETKVVALLQDLLGVLAFVHEQGVIHRDIKPANLMRRDHDRRIVLIDFGAVKQVRTQVAQPSAGATQTIVIGTPGYMPNEQLAGTPRLSSDVYAVGMIGIQALTGVSPKSLPEDPLTGEILWRPQAPDVSEALAAVLDQMIRYDFRARYAKAGLALAALTEAIAAEDLDPTSPWLTQQFVNQGAPAAANGPHQSVPMSVQPSQAATQPLWQPALASGAQASLAALNTVWRFTLTPLKRLEPRQRMFSLASLAVLGGLIALVRPTPSSLPLSQSLPRAEVSPAATSPSPVVSPSPDPTTQATARLTQAHQLRERKQFAQALTAYGQAIALNPKLPDAHWGRCYSLNTLEQFTAAIAACDAALKLQPNYAEALWSKGYARDRQDQDQEALALYERATTLKPELAAAWNNKGAVLLQLKRPAEALVAFEQATRRQPNFAEAWNGRGAALWYLDRFDDAIASVDKALKLQPDYQPAVNLRREMRQRTGQP
jgi:eukaryotic-like serine/threonine-protein kinase